jgi:Right handed beta helix region
MLLAVAAVAACIDPAAFGAVPDDNKPDTDAIQQAIEAAEAVQGEVCLGKGTFELDPRRLSSLWIRKGSITFRGAGDKTILEMSGDSKRATWFGLFLNGAAHVVLRDFTMKATRTRNTQEQTHLIQIGPGASDVQLDRLRLGPMRRNDQKVGDGAGGDCVRLLGEQDQMVEDVTISDSDFIGCDRSGITVQRGVRRLVVASDSFSGIGDTPIDFEPTATVPIEDVSFVHLAITRSDQAQGAWAMTIAGFGMTNPTQHVVVADCDLIGGGIGLLNTQDVVISDNRIKHGTGVGDTIHIMRAVDGLLIQDNTIVRPATAPAAPLIGLTHNNGGIPTHVRVIHNELRQETDAAVIDDTSASSFAVRDNHIVYAGHQPMYAIDVHAIAAQIDDVELTGNKIEGPVRAVVRLVASRAGLGRVSLAHNRSDHPAVSVECVESLGKFRAPVHEDGDEFDGAPDQCAVLRQVAPVSSRKP